jgi:hypothetical protein
MQSSNEAAGITQYVIQRVYLDDSAKVAVGIAKDQLTVNIGAVTLVMSPELARHVTAEIAVARMVHDMKYLEDVTS